MSFGSSKSAVTNETTNILQDQRVAASEGGIAVSGGGTFIQETVSDDIAVAAIDAATGTASRVADSSLSLADRSLQSSQDTVRANVDLAKSVTELAVTNLEKNKRDPNDDTLQTLSKQATNALMAIAALVAAVFLFRKRKAA